MGRTKITVAVDGPAGSGKSSVSREVAGRLGLKYIDSGAIYRSITLFLLRKHGALSRDRAYAGDLEGLRVEQTFNPGGNCTSFINGEDVSGEIRSELIAKNIGIISDEPGVREFVNGCLREWGGSESIIMDGRDIGTVVFPDADIKVYLDASVDVRADRRHREYLESGKTVDLNAIRNQIIQRDREDTSRPVGALRKAADAIIVDTSHMTRPEVVEKLVAIIGERS
jgi:cytidylate kinase